MKVLFKIREFAWVIVSEIEDWLYPYRNRLTPDEQFEIRVKDPMSGENFMVEEHIQSQNERIERLQDEMITVCLLYTSPSPRDSNLSRMPSSA